MQRALTSLFCSTLPLTILSCLTSLTAKAQVIPDGTTNTTVNVDGNDVTIEQGSRIGENLFHSFNEFSVLTDSSAFFNNAADIANIFSRVTGNNISNIDGLLRANGAANLFLINPNGIIFGPNARLNLGGSFFASSADSFLFEGNAEFSASNPTAPPLLTISVPIGINFRDNPGDIVNRSTVQNSAGDVIGLEVLPGNNLTLVGGNINFEAGNTNARDGNIELGGLSIGGTVDINNNGSLSFPKDVAQADITLSNAAKVDVRGTDGGSITINARNLNLEAGDLGFSKIRAGITADSTSTEAQAGDITISATNNVTVNDSVISNRVKTEAVGDAGDITINTDSLSLTNGGIVSASTFSQGNAGNITINANNTITMDGEDSNGFPSSAFSSVNTGAEGNAGDVTITTGSLTLTNGGRVDASTFSQGNAGSVEITASDTITINGESSEGFNSAVGSQVNLGAVGDAGGVTITTGSLTLTNGGRVDASTLGKGNAGNVTINAREKIEISGAIESFRSGISTDALINSGNGGDINVFTNRLTINDGGTIEAGNLDSLKVFAPGTGQPGNINIEANSLSLNNQARINTTTQSETGDSANITLELTEDLILRNNSLISARPFGKANGGNIDIDAEFIIAFPSQPPENGNDIVAKTSKPGVERGNITINNALPFGIQERPAIPGNGTNDIDASSESGLPLRFYTTSILIKQKVIDASDQISQNICEQGIGSEFIITGKGGLPPNPGEPLNNNEEQVGLVEPVPSRQGEEKTKRQEEEIKLEENDINSEKSTTEAVPAQGWIFTDTGEVMLTSYDPTNSGIQRSQQKPISCPTP